MTNAVLIREDRGWREEKREQTEGDEREEMLTQPHSHEASSKVEVKGDQQGERLTLTIFLGVGGLKITLQANVMLRGGGDEQSVSSDGINTPSDHRGGSRHCALTGMTRGPV